MTFRTLFTILNTEDKKIAGSVLPHILELDSPTIADGKKSDKSIADVFPAGSFLDDVKIARVNNTGVWATLDGVDGVCGYVHVSRLSDEHIATVSGTTGKYKIGTTHRARVLTYNPVDALLVLTLQPSVLAEKFLRVADIEIGSMVECEVERLIPAGIIVKVSKSISGLVPTVHMADVKLTRPEFKFKVGKKIQCRVLKTDLLKQKVFLTLKKSLINSEYPIFKDIAECKVDDVSHGVIIAIKNNGCVVSYYNNLAAFAPGNEMTETRIANLGEVFNIGQTVKTTVLKVDPEENKMLVSFINTKKKLKRLLKRRPSWTLNMKPRTMLSLPVRSSRQLSSLSKRHISPSLYPVTLEVVFMLPKSMNPLKISKTSRTLSANSDPSKKLMSRFWCRNTKLNTLFTYHPCCQDQATCGLFS